MTEPSFRFRLERVRALRERREDLARQALSEALTRLSDSQTRLNTVNAHLEQARAEQRQAAGPSVTANAAELQGRQAFLERIEAQRLAGMRELQRSETEVAERDLDLGRAARDRQMLERLKERRREEHRREFERQENSALDEIALDRFRRSAA